VLSQAHRHSQKFVIPPFHELHVGIRADHEQEGATTQECRVRRKMRERWTPFAQALLRHRLATRITLLGMTESPDVLTSFIPPDVRQ
jgi:hypothetical protein